MPNFAWSEFEPKIVQFRSFPVTLFIKIFCQDILLFTQVTIFEPDVRLDFKIFSIELSFEHLQIL